MNAEDPFELDRFVQAQEAIYGQALSELKNGHKRSHWMWFIFPQFAGLGFSMTTRRYSIKSRAEAIDYLEHPVLGSRLLDCTRALLSVHNKDISKILGYPDDLKFHSSMTLFEIVSEGSENNLFDQALNHYFSGRRDSKTLMLVAQSQEQ
jgi:uncharacterized protein (DUF1810 family)